MKTICFTLVFFLSVGALSAQQVKPYQAIIKTVSAKHKGILYKVDSFEVVLNNDGEFINIPLNEIKTAQIRTVKKGYKGKSFIKIGEDRAEEYKVDSRGKRVDKWGKEEPTLAEDASATVYSVFFTALANAIALPIHAINPNVASFRLQDHNPVKLNELRYYSIYYQANPDVIAELHQIKAISASFKP